MFFEWCKISSNGIGALAWHHSSSTMFFFVSYLEISYPAQKKKHDPFSELRTDLLVVGTLSSSLAPYL
jgi:hypothetical protein